MAQGHLYAQHSALLKNRSRGRRESLDMTDPASATGSHGDRHESESYHSKERDMPHHKASDAMQSPFRIYEKT